MSLDQEGIRVTVRSFLFDALLYRKGKTPAHDRGLSLKQMMGMEINPTPEKITAIAATIFLAAARSGSTSADEDLVNLAIDLNERGVQLPLPLQDYILAKALKSTGRKGRPNRDFITSLAIAAAVALLEKHFYITHSIKHTNRDSPGAEGGCSIVASILADFNIFMTEGNVIKIYEDYRHIAADVFPS